MVFEVFLVALFFDSRSLLTRFYLLKMSIGCRADEI